MDAEAPPPAPAEDEKPENRSLLDLCEAGDRKACADAWNQLSPNIAYETPEAGERLIRSTCDGGVAQACKAAEIMDRPAPDPVASKRFLAAMDRLPVLQSRWIEQLTTLSQMKCATGAASEIESEWAKGATQRQSELDELEKTVEDVRPKVGSLADVWTPHRANFDRAIASALAAAKQCALKSK